MNFFCFKCNETFVSSEAAIKHLKKNHFMIDNIEAIKCVVKQCDKTYNTFKGLSKNLKSFDHQTLENVCIYH